MGWQAMTMTIQNSLLCAVFLSQDDYTMFIRVGQETW